MDELILRARRGDSAALTELLATVAPSLQRFGMLMCRDQTDAEDVLQDALISIASHLSEFEGRSSFSSWAFTLARSACSRKRRGLKNQPATPLDEVSETAAALPSPEQYTSNQELASALNRALASLPEDYREAIILRDVEEMTAPEAAESLGITVEALKSRLHRARNALRDALRPVLEPSPLSTDATCPDVLALWSQKLEGDLSTTDCAQMERHIATCKACSSACAALKTALLACRNARADVVSPEVKVLVQTAVNRWLRSECSGPT